MTETVDDDDAAALAKALTDAGFHVHTRREDIDRTIDVPVFGADVHVALSATRLALVPDRFLRNDAVPGGILTTVEKSDEPTSWRTVVLGIAFFLLVAFVVWRLT